MVGSDSARGCKNAGNARPWLAPEEQTVTGNAAYGASKAGVHALTGFLAGMVMGAVIADILGEIRAQKQSG